MKQKLPERRRFIRAEIPAKLVVKGGSHTDEIIAKNISPVGLGFEIGRELKDSEMLEVSLYLPSIDEPIALEGRVAWHNKVSREDDAPYDVGLEIVGVEDEKKNIFLKYLCDVLYESAYKERT